MGGGGGGFVCQYYARLWAPVAKQFTLTARPGDNSRKHDLKNPMRQDNASRKQKPAFVTANASFGRWA